MAENSYLCNSFQRAEEVTSRDEKYKEMTTEPVERLVCKFAVPAIIGMLISSIYNIADTFFVGRLDTQSTAALGVVFSYMGIIQAVAFYVGHGSGNFISRCLGARKGDEAENMASTGFFLAIAVASAIAATCGIFIRPVLTLFGSTPTVLPYAVSYFRWILAGTPFIVGAIVLNNQMRLQGNVRKDRRFLLGYHGRGRIGNYYIYRAELRRLEDRQNQKIN